MHNGTHVLSPDEAYFGAASRNGDAPVPTYYDRPMLKTPHWEWNVVTYLFLGGIMGGLGLIQLLCRLERREDRTLKRAARISSFVLAAANPGILITHLGRPERFLNMLRIVKFKSPMSMGVWGLVLYSGAAGANTVRELAISGVLAALDAFPRAGLSRRPYRHCSAHSSRATRACCSPRPRIRCGVRESATFRLRRSARVSPPRARSRRC